MKSISQINKRYLPHELKTRIHAVETYRNGNSIDYVCRKYHISRISLWRWDKKYDGTPESLMDKSHRPISRHPNAHTDEEIKWIKDLIRRNPHITLCELWIKLKINKGYNRHIVSLYRVLKRIGFYNQPLISGTSKYGPTHIFAYGHISSILIFDFSIYLITFPSLYFLCSFTIFISTISSSKAFSIKVILLFI